MPRTRAQNASRRQRSKTTIRQAALEVFAQHGYEQASMAMVAEQAGVSQGLAYNYFEGKEDMLRSVIRRRLADVQRSFDEADEGASPSQKIERLVASSFRIVRENQRFWKLFYSLRTQPPLLTLLRSDMLSWTGQIRDRLAIYLKEAGADDPATEAHLLFAVIDGAAQHYVLAPDFYPLERVQARINQQFCPN